MSEPFFVKVRGHPLMKQLAALEASRLQYDQVTNVMPQLSAEINTLTWLYSVMNKGEGTMAVMNMNVPERAKGGGVEGVDYNPNTQQPPNAPQSNMMVDPKETKKRKRVIKDGFLYTQDEDSDMGSINFADLNDLASHGNQDVYDYVEALQAQKEERSHKSRSSRRSSVAESWTENPVFSTVPAADDGGIFSVRDSRGQ
jgi:hypothetical protein